MAMNFRTETGTPIVWLLDGHKRSDRVSIEPPEVWLRRIWMIVVRPDLDFMQRTHATIQHGLDLLDENDTGELDDRDGFMARRLQPYCDAFSKGQYGVVVAGANHISRFHPARLYGLVRVAQKRQMWSRGDWKTRVNWWLDWPEGHGRVIG